MGCLDPRERNWQINGSDLLVFEDPTWGSWEPTITAYRRLPIPQSLLADYGVVLQRADLSCPPLLELVENAGGRGGFFLPGLIVLGKADTRALANRIAERRLHRLNPLQALRATLDGKAIFNRQTFYKFVRGRILRHEVGHALRHDQDFQTPFQDEELAADDIAGVFDGLEGVKKELSDLVFAEIGCALPRCSHPAPRHRRHAHSTGYRRAVLATASR